jgi:glycosyltransferase involved in cell wall biosynthesis
MTNILAAIPALNESKTIASVVLLAKQYVDSVIVIDDGSQDGTAKLAKAAGAHVIVHNKNLGKGSAILSAFKWAYKNKFDIIVVIDGDGQHDPGVIPGLIKPILEGECDLTIGSRWKHDEGLEEMPFHRVIGNWVLSTATSLSLNKMILDSQSGFRAYHVRTIPAMMQAMETGFSTESELITLADKAGYKWKEVGIRASYSGLDTSSQPSWFHGLSVLAKAMRVLRIHKPVRFFGFLSIMSFITALVLVMFERTYGDRGIITIFSMYTIPLLMIGGAFFMFSGIMLLGMNKVSERVLDIMLDIIKKHQK